MSETLTFASGDRVQFTAAIHLGGHDGTPRREIARRGDLGTITAVLDSGGYDFVCEADRAEEPFAVYVYEVHPFTGSENPAAPEPSPEPETEPAEEPVAPKVWKIGEPCRFTFGRWTDAKARVASLSPCGNFANVRREGGVKLIAVPVSALSPR